MKKVNTDLYIKLGIDPNLGLRDLLEELGAKENEYSERAQSASDEKRREELQEIIEEIEREIEYVEKEIESAKFGIVTDDEPEPAAEPEPPRLALEKPQKPAPEKPPVNDIREPDKNDLKIEQFIKRAQGRDDSQPANTAPVNAPAPQPSAPRTPAVPPNSLQAGIIALNNSDYATAVRILQPLADNNDPGAMIAIANMYKEGRGYPQDIKGFVFWLEKAVANGSVNAAGLLGEHFISTAQNSTGFNSSVTKKELSRALDLLEIACDKHDMYFIEQYVRCAEAKYSTLISNFNTVIGKVVKKKHVKKAIEYCNFMASNITDAYLQQQWIDRAKALKKGAPYNADGSKPVRVRKSHGCLWWFVVIILIIWVFSLIFSWLLSHSDFLTEGRGSSAAQTATSAPEAAAVEAAAPVAEFGEAPLELHDMPEFRVTQLEKVKTVNNSDRWVGLENLNQAFLFQATSNHAAYASYNIEGKFELFEFRVYPFFYDEFDDSVVDKILVYDGDTEEVLSETEITGDSKFTPVSVDVKGRNNITVSVSFVSGNLSAYQGSVFIKDAYLYPSAKDEKIKPAIDELNSTEAAKQFGAEKTELHDVPQGFFLKSWRRNDTTDSDYTIDGEIWRSAYQYKATSSSVSFSDYLTDGRFKRLKFKATPFSTDHFPENVSATLSVIDLDKDEVLYEQEVTSSSGVINGNVNIKSRKRIRIIVKFKDGPYGMGECNVLLKDAYLYPAEKQADKESANNGVELHDLPEGSITESKNFITDPGTHSYSPDGTDWSNAYILGAKSKSPVAYAVFKLDKKYKTLTFKATPLREGDLFPEKGAVKLAYYGKEDKSQKITSDPTVTEVTVDVTDQDTVMLKVIVVPTDPNYYNGYLLIKDAYLT